MRILRSWNRRVWAASFVAADADFRLEVCHVVAESHLGLLAAGFALAGCMPATTYQAAPEASISRAIRPSSPRRALCQCSGGRAVPPRLRRLSPQGDARYHRGRFRQPLPLSGAGRRQGDTLRRHRRRGSPGLLRIAKVGNMAEWPKWTPTADIHKRNEGLPASVPGGVDNPLGPARSTSTRQQGHPVPASTAPTSRNIGASISSGCIRMTNEDVHRPLYPRQAGHGGRRARPKQGDSPYNSKIGAAGRAARSGRCRSNRRRLLRRRKHLSPKIKSAGFAGAFSLRVFPLSAARPFRRLVG